jgi:hypothetical protein
MADITYSLETLTGKHGGLLEVVEAIVSDQAPPRFPDS